jgi:hypothetical protein
MHFYKINVSMKNDFFRIRGGFSKEPEPSSFDRPALSTLRQAQGERTKPIMVSLSNHKLRMNEEKANPKLFLKWNKGSTELPLSVSQFFISFFH